MAEEPTDDQPTDAGERPTDPPGPDASGSSPTAETAPMTATDPAGSDESPVATGGPSWLYLLGLLGFLVTAIAFVADLWTGHDVRRSIAINALAAVVLVTWAGLDSYRDRDSGVTTLAGAIGTGMILVGVYLLAAGAVVAATSVVHERSVIGLGMVAGGVPLVLGGFLVFPVDAVLGDDADPPDSESTEGDGDPDDPA